MNIQGHRAHETGGVYPPQEIPAPQGSWIKQKVRAKGTFQATNCGSALCCTCVRSSWFLTPSPGQELGSDPWCPPWLCC